MTLYEINAAIEAAIERMLESVDPETGEVNEQDARALDELQEAKKEKLDNIGAYIKNLTAEVAALKEEADKLKARAKSKENHIDRLKQYVADSMQAEGVTKVETTRVAFSFRPSVAVNITNEEAIPKQYLTEKITYSPNKTAIKKALDAGEVIEGAVLEHRQNLQIK